MRNLQRIWLPCHVHIPALTYDGVVQLVEIALRERLFPRSQSEREALQSKHYYQMQSVTAY
jgi:hypothetical protein